MDMTYIKEKLHSLGYESVVDFVNDVKLIFSNCRSYNPVSKSNTHLAFAKAIDIHFRKFWLAPVTRDIQYY